MWWWQGRIQKQMQGRFWIWEFTLVVGLFFYPLAGFYDRDWFISGFEPWNPLNMPMEMVVRRRFWWRWWVGWWWSVVVADRRPWWLWSFAWYAAATNPSSKPFSNLALLTRTETTHTQRPKHKVYRGRRLDAQISSLTDKESIPYRLTDKHTEA